jgi:hypothetical protein
MRNNAENIKYRIQTNALVLIEVTKFKYFRCLNCYKNLKSDTFKNILLNFHKNKNTLNIQKCNSLGGV